VITTMSEAFTKAITSIPVLGSAMQGRVSARRAFLAGGVAATASAAVMASIESATGAPSVSSDAELIGLCAVFDALEHKLQASYEGIVTDAGWDAADVVADAVREEQAPILDAITACRPSTLAGFTALAGSLALWDTELLEGDPMQGCTNDRLALVLFRGMIGRAVA